MRNEVAGVRQLLSRSPAGNFLSLDIKTDFSKSLRYLNSPLESNCISIMLSCLISKIKNPLEDSYFFLCIAGWSRDIPLFIQL